MRVLKFGGSSVATAERIREVAAIVTNKYTEHQNLIVVTSALRGITDQLALAGHQARAGDEMYRNTLSEIEKRHTLLIQELFKDQALLKTSEFLSEQIKQLNDFLYGVFLIRELSKSTLDRIMSYGEILSTYIVSVCLQTSIPQARFINASEIIKTDRHFGSARVIYPITNALIQERLAETTFLPVITGFIGSTEQGEITTLGRGGSDFTASILGAALNVEEIEIWTDVDGVMTADPRKVLTAFPLAQITYKEAMEMSYFGAKVIYPPTIVPAFHAEIPISIRNTFNPTAPGTLIFSTPQSYQNMPIRGISSISDIALLRVEGGGLIGVTGTSKRVFSALADRNINVVLITQGSSEHSICFAVNLSSAEEAKEALEKEFDLDMQAGLIEPLIIDKNVSIIAVVGEKMSHTPAVPATLFAALAKNGINSLLIAQGSSQYNITFVVNTSDEDKALNVIHEEFFLSPTKKVHLFMIGIGLVGRTLLKQIEKHQVMLGKEFGLELKLVALGNSKKMLIDVDTIAIENWEDTFNNRSIPMDTASFIQQMKELNLRNSVFIDCTANEEVSAIYEDVLNSTISIVTPNKRANSGNYNYYLKLKELAKNKKIKFSYEANVGGGLPIISTIKNLLSSGDTITKIEAVLSGTLSYIFNEFMHGKSFSETVKEAQARGFTEPDPREDLNGMDVKRKLLILSRECHHPLEMGDISLDTFLPQECTKEMSIAQFYECLEKNDQFFNRLRKQALEQGKVLRHIVYFENGKGAISLRAVDASHPFFSLAGSDNVIALTTERYSESPLIIQGKGAGSEVTAAKVLAGIIDCAKE